VFRSEFFYPPAYPSQVHSTSYHHLKLLINRKEQSEMTPRNAFNVVVEAAILHAIASAQQTLQQEVPHMDQMEVSLGKLAALAHVVAQEIAAVEQRESKNVATSFPAGPGTLFITELQDELHRLYRLKE
jgi:hypothetical protein